MSARNHVTLMTLCTIQETTEPWRAAAPVVAHTERELTATGIRYVYIGYHDIHDRGRERAVRMSATSSSSDPNWGAMVHAWGGSEPDSRVVLNGRACRDARNAGHH